MTEKTIQFTPLPSNVDYNTMRIAIAWDMARTSLYGSNFGAVTLDQLIEAYQKALQGLKATPDSK